MSKPLPAPQDLKPHYPVLINGAGINGSGLLRELCLQGVNCLVFDRKVQALASATLGWNKACTNAEIALAHFEMNKLCVRTSAATA